MQMATILKDALPAYARKLPKFEMPDWMVHLYAIFDGDVRGNLAELGIVKPIDNSRVKSLLGRDLISAEDALIAMAKSLVAQKLV